MKKRMLSLLTALCLTLTLAPAAFAVEEGGNEVPMEESTGITTIAELNDAISNATTGQTIELSGNVTGDVLISKDITLNLATHTITGQVSVPAGVSVTIQKGTIAYAANTTNATAALYIHEDATVSLVDVDIIVTGTSAQSMGIAVYGELTTDTDTTIDSTCYGIGFYDSAKATLTGTTVLANQNPISTNVSGSANMDVTITGGLYKCRTLGNWSYVAIYWASHGKLTVNSGTFTSASTEAAGLYVKNGDINIVDGTFTGTKDGVKVTSEEANSTGIDVTITGGTFSGTRCGLYVKMNANGGANSYNVIVTGGTFGQTNVAAIVTSITSNLPPHVELNNGTYYGGITSYNFGGFVYGGKYKVNPKEYLAETAESEYNEDDDFYYVASPEQ